MSEKKTFPIDAIQESFDESSPADSPTGESHEEEALENESLAYAGEATDVETELAAAHAELQDVKNQLLRSHAETENVRKRLRRDMEEQARYAALPMLNDLLNVLDNLERAVAAAEENGGAEGLLEGVKMVAVQLSGVLERHHCRPIDTSAGLAFNPNLHEALSQQPSKKYPAGTVTQTIRAGYQLHDRVVRPAQVFVSSGPPPGE